MKRLASLALVALTACQTPLPIKVIEPVEVLVPVAQPCALPRPAPVEPLQRQYGADAWEALDVRQKAALVAAQGLDRQTYGEQLDAATAACPVVE